MSIGQKFKEFISPMDDDEIIEIETEVEEEEEEQETLSKYEQPKSKVINKINDDTKMVLFEPRSFDEAREVAKRIKEEKAVVVNLHRLQRSTAQRTIDFLTGVIFALDGAIQKIGPNIVLCTPSSVEVHGKIEVETGEED